MIRVLVIDDSASVRAVLTRILNGDPDIEVVGTAVDPLDAREQIKQLNPDVLTLDVEMPKMSGLTFLENLMRLRPMPVVMVSSLTDKGTDTTLRALELGAFDCAFKPDARGETLLAADLINKIKLASKVDLGALKRVAFSRLMAQRVHPPLLFSDRVVVVMAASTGGPAALHDLLRQLPENFPPILLVQHLREGFHSYFATRLNKAIPMTVLMAESQMRIQKGYVYVAPNGFNLVIQSKGGLICELETPQENARHKPSADRLFSSAAEILGDKATGVILTGMGDDGARGLGEIFQAGGKTFAQDKSTSIVWGMPGAAVHMGSVSEVLSLTRIATRLLEVFSRP